NRRLEGERPRKPPWVVMPGIPERLLGFCFRDGIIVLVHVLVLAHDFVVVNI
ncbi:MAG: hypothetical protein GX804_00470, partial [Lentisphaerae bacterium]|nr:hypothetical protein [Lentisphaerota bacterium]